MTSPPQDLYDLLIRHEGTRLKPYDDATGHELRRGDVVVGQISIGTGRNLTDKGITSSEAMLLLSHDVQEVLTDLCNFPWFTTIGPVRLRALADLRFNVGPRSFRGFHRLLAAVEAGNFARAAADLLESQWAHQVQPARVTDLHTMLLTGVQP